MTKTERDSSVIWAFFVFGPLSLAICHIIRHLIFYHQLDLTLERLNFNLER
jgi:hypothetical protein